MTETSRNEWLPGAGSRWIVPVLLALVGVAMAWWSWGKWPDVMIDFGRELYVPWRLVEGDVLYRDVAYFHGPVSPFLNTAVFRLFGTSLLSLELWNLAVLAGVTAMLWTLLSRIAGRSGAAACGVVFLAMFAFSQMSGNGNYNFVAPYSHEMTHGIALSLAVLLFFWRYLRRGGRFGLLATGAALGLLFLTKPEFLIATGPAVAVGLVSAAWLRRDRPAVVARSALFLLAGAVVPPLIAFLLLLGQLRPDEALRGIFGSWPDIVRSDLRELRFYRVGMGTATPVESARRMLVWSAYHLIALTPALVAGWTLRRTSRWRVPVAIAIGLLIAVPLVVYWRSIVWGYLASPLPLWMLGGAIVLVARVVRDRRRGTTDPRLVLALSTTVFAGLLLLKIALNTRFYHYGFVLAMPAAMLIVLGLVSGVPRILHRAGANGAAFRVAALILLASVVTVHLRITADNFATKVHPVGTGADRFYDDARAVVAQQTVDWLDRRLGPDATLAVLPEGVMLNYLTRRRNPTPFVNFMPPEIIVFGEDRIVSAFAAAPPDYIVLTNRGANEYGFRVLGRDYGEKIMAWIQANYRLADQVRDSERKGEPFSLCLILQRIDAPPPGR